MLKQIEWLKDCGHFSDYHWDSGLPDLAQINVVFGANGTGKSSLAAAFDGLRFSDDGKGAERVSFAIENQGGLITSNGAVHDLFDRIHVFGDRYIEKSHRFHSEPEMDAVLTVGQQSVEDELKLETVKVALANALNDQAAAIKKQDKAAKAIESGYGRVSESVVNAVSKAGGRWKSRGSFSAGAVRRAFEGSHVSWKKLSADQLREKVSIANSAKADLLPKINPSTEIPGGIVERLSSALATTPITEILNTLEAHPEASSWVQAGRKFHEGENICIFCAGPLDETRKAQIDRHFSEAVAKQQQELRSIIQELARLEAAANKACADLPPVGLLFEDLRGAYGPVSATLGAELKTLAVWAKKAMTLADEKLDNVLASVNSEVSAPEAVNPGALLEVCRQHDARVEAHEQQVLGAAQSVEAHYLKTAEVEVHGQAQIVAEVTTELEALGKKIKSMREEIASLENIEGDPMPSARVLTEEVARLLGRNELAFQAEDGRYCVTRNGEPAVGLSTGERSAIMLIHFMETVARFDKGNPIVIIDDPVSSMDSDVFMGVSTYIWSEMINKKHAAQLILLTHNYELFRQWDIQMEGAGKYAPPHKFYEIRSTTVTKNGVTKRQPNLVAWPPNKNARKKIRSSYHHAFIAIEEAKRKLDQDDNLENRLEAQLMFPNVIRRVLESFLAFKFPEQVGNFNGSMSQAGKMLKDVDYQGDADALRLRLTRYTHAYSHSESPATNDVVSPDEVRTAIAAAFEFMNALDSGHFEGLCKVLDLDRDALLEGYTASAEPMAK